jgi:hypothetical protein
MPKLEVKLSANGMRNIAIWEVQKDFYLIVSDNQSVPHALDPSICQFRFETKDDQEEFDKFLSLGCGEFCY